MAEKKTVYRWFWVWDFQKEEAWLNEMAMNGWALTGVGFCRYTFEACDLGEYIIRLEMHGLDDAYLSFMEEIGAQYVGRFAKWIFFRRASELGQFDIFSDIDSKIAHLDRIGRLIIAVGGINLIIGIVNSFNSSNFGWVNLLCATLLMYGAGRIHGLKEALTAERQLHE